jgi:hypothetical protein
VQLKDSNRSRRGRRTLLRRSHALGAAVAVAVGTWSAGALAVDNVWTGAADNNYNNPANWSLGRVPVTPNGQPAPDDFDDAVINSTPANVATIGADIAATPRDIIVGSGAGTNGTVNHNAGTARTGTGNWMFVGRDGGTGTYNLTGSGSLDVKDRLYVAGHNGAAATGTLNVNTTGTITAGGDLNLGAANGTGTMNLTAGTVNVGAWLSIGRDENGTDGTGVVNQTGGTFNVNLNTIVALPGTTGNYTMTGGTNATNGELWVGQGRDAAGPAVGTMTVNAGTVTANNWIAVGREGGTGTLNVGGTGSVREIGGGETHFTIGTGSQGSGTVNVSAGGLVETNADFIVAENNATAVGVVNQTGGTVIVGRNLEVQRVGTGTYNLSGGTLSVAGHIDAVDGTFNFTGGKITRPDAGTVTVNGNLATTGATFIDAGAGKTFDVNGTLDVTGGIGLDLAGRSVTVGAGSIDLGLVDSINGEFEAPTITNFNAGGATLISESAGEGGAFNPATQSVYWIQEAGGAVTLEYSVVPEPGTVGVFALSGLALLARRRRKA